MFMRALPGRESRATLDAPPAAVTRTSAHLDQRRRILRAVGERLGIASDRVVDCIAKLGNTSAATIPLALAQAKRAGHLREGSRVLLGAFGAGLSWGATVIEWGGAVSVGV